LEKSSLSPIVEFAPFRLDVIDERLWRGQEVRPLTPKAFAVLRCLVAHPGQLVTKDTLMDTVWPETAISVSTLTGCIWEVRQDFALTPVKGFFELRAILHNPAVNGGVIHVDATLEHQFFDMAGAQRIHHIPGHTHENDVLWKMGALEAIPEWH